MSKDKKSKSWSGTHKKYRQHFCDLIVNEMQKGFSKTAACSAISISLETCEAWEQEYPEFAEAVAFGHAARTHTYETALMYSMMPVDVTKNIFRLKNAAPHEWADRKAVDLSSKDGSMVPQPVNIVIQGVDSADE